MNMIIEIKIPSPGESITEVEIGRWLVEEGSLVRQGQEIAEVESDKATLTIIAEAAGRVTFLAAEGQSVAVGSVACTIDTSAALPAGASLGPSTKPPVAAEAPLASSTAGAPGVPLSEGGLPAKGVTTDAAGPELTADAARLRITAVAREVMKEHGLSVEDLLNGLRRIGRREVEEVVRLHETPPGEAGKASSSGSEPAATEWGANGTTGLSREITRERMTPLRRRLSERLVSVKNETAMLTTFNEVDMSAIMELRREYQQRFTEQYGFKLGFMAFFTRAAALALQIHPSVNAQIAGEELLMPQYADIGIAVQTPKGLMVPVIRNVESKSIPAIESEIKELAEKARNKKISVEELSGGTFTITNGGVFGSLFSTPIINPPQSAILGMHNIVERPVAVGGKVEIRPMMYIALSYDHRVIDGKDSVGFLVRVKELIENPDRMALSGKDPAAVLLGL